MNGYDYDREKKRVVAPNGELLNVNKTTHHLNQMFFSLDYLYGIWGELHNLLAAMDGVFLGASQPEAEVKEDDYIEEEEEVKDKEHKEHKEPNTNSTTTSLPNTPTDEE